MHAAYTHEDLPERLGEREGRCCHAAVTERARSSEPRGAAAAAGERPRRDAEEEPTTSDGPWLRLTCSWFCQWVISTFAFPSSALPVKRAIRRMGGEGSHEGDPSGVTSGG